MTIQTRNTTYTLEDMGDGGFLISGHPKYCPSPVPCQVKHPIRVGECMMFNTYEGAPITKWVMTSPVVKIIR